METNCLILILIQNFFGMFYVKGDARWSHVKQIPRLAVGEPRETGNLRHHKQENHLHHINCSYFNNISIMMDLQF